MINWVGLVVILLGFFAPYIGNGWLPPTYLFWLGFLLLLWPSKYFSKVALWLKWARIGLLLDVAVTLLSYLFLTVVLKIPLLAGNYFINILLRVISWVSAPVNSIVKLFLPPYRIHMPDGSVQFTISFIGVSIISFLDVLIFILIGIIIGKLISGKLDKRDHKEKAMDIL